MDLFNKCFRYTDAKDAMKTGNYPFFIAMTSSHGPISDYRGRKLIMCGSNNYLGLTTHPEVRAAARNAIDRFGSSCTERDQRRDRAQVGQAGQRVRPGRATDRLDPERVPGFNESRSSRLISLRRPSGSAAASDAGPEARGKGRVRFKSIQPIAQKFGRCQAWISLSWARI